MLVLGFDTATAACSAALSDDGEILARRHQLMSQGHAERLIGIINYVMEEAGKAFEDLDLLAVTTGPGSFTGLRIGLATARGLALAGDLPCMGITTLDAVAAAIPESERDAAILVAIESKRDDIYVQAFGAGLEPLAAPQAVLPDALAAALADLSITGGRIVVAGDAAARAVDGLSGAGLDVVLSAAPDMPDAAIVAALAASRWSPSVSVERPRPVYLRPPDATVPKDGGRLRP